MEKHHVLGSCPNGFRMSSYLQDIVAYLGSDYVFEQASAVLNKLLFLDVSAKQIENVSETIGEILEEEEQEKIDRQEALPSDLVNSQEVLTYVEIDGSMVFTREEKWKETKLGRIFQLPVNQAPTGIKHSEYFGHLGDSATFLSGLERLIPQVECPIFIADGAPWIWNWVKKCYPKAIQILDFYHAMEYAHGFAREAFPDEANRKSWIDGVKNYLLTDRIGALIRHFELLESSVKKEHLPSLLKLKVYYQNNQDRMYYGFYRDKKLLIGSGAIEAAHREVIQKRMKLSGQRWSKQGAKAILKLRTTKKSAKWNQVIHIAKYGKLAA